MSHIDDLFRDGLSGRNADVPNSSDLWARINAAKQKPLPEGEDLDRTFSDKLRDRVAPVPAGMWARIAAARARKPVARWLLSAAALLLLLITVGVAFNRASADSPQQPAGPNSSDTPVAQVEGLTVNKVAGDQATNETFSPEDAATTNETSSEGLPVGTEAPPSTPSAATTTNNSLPPTMGTEADQVEEVVAAPSTTSLTPVRPLRTAVAVKMLPGDPAQLALPEAALPETAPLATSTFRNSGSKGLQTELLFGISYARQEFSLQDPAAASLRDLRQASEYPEFGYQITLRGTYRFSERVRLLAGLTYAEIRNELEYDLFSNGTSTLVRTNNNIRMLETPVLLGYSVPGRRVNVTVNAGPVINLTTAVRGRFLDPDFSQPQDLAAEGNFRKNVGVGFMTSLSTTYQIGKKHPFTLLVEPYFKTYPTAFTVKNAPVREKYWVAGIQLGVRKTLR